MIKQLQLCTKQGNGICINCLEEYKSTVHCRYNVAQNINFQLEILDEMMNLFLRYSNEFKSKAEILDYLDARELEDKLK